MHECAISSPELSQPILESYWVVPGKLLAGEYPGHWKKMETRRRIGALLQAGFDNFIDLTHPDELAPYESILHKAAALYNMQAVYHRFPIGDFGLPTPEQMFLILGTIDEAIQNCHKTYLHCWGGIGRTGTTVGCYLVRHGMSGAQALKQLAEWWQFVPKSERFPHSPETDAQSMFVLEWQKKDVNRDG